jgi:hypothetical protein
MDSPEPARRPAGLAPVAATDHVLRRGGRWHRRAELRDGHHPLDQPLSFGDFAQFAYGADLACTSLSTFLPHLTSLAPTFP